MRIRRNLPILLLLLTGIAVAHLAIHAGPVNTINNLSSGLARLEQAQAQPGESVIRVKAPSVVVDVIATDKKGRHVEGLKAEDFSVSEDNTPQKIVGFESTSGATGKEAAQQATEKPPGRLTAPPSGAESMKAQALARSLASVRFITLVVDMGDLQPNNVKRSCDAAVQYVTKVVAPEDFLAVYRVDNTLHLAQPFTQDKRLVVEALKAMSGRAPTGRMTAMLRISTQEQIDDLNARLWGLQAVGGLGPGISGADAAGGGTGGALLAREIATLRKFLFTQSTMQARTVFVALRSIAQSYADIPGRKNVVMFSEGFIRSPDAKPQMNAVIDAANRANVAIYVVDSSGLKAGFGAENSAPELNDNQLMYEMGLWGPSHDQFDNMGRIGHDNLQDDLGQVAAGTGGFIIKNQNDLLPGLAKVDSDLREFYTLVYQPTDTNYDGSFRRIKVELNKPGYHIRYRLGYWAIPPGEEMMMTPAAAQLLAGVAGGSLKSSFEPQVNGAVLLAPNGQLAAPVQVSMPTDRVKFSKDPKHDSYLSAVTLVLAGRDATGRLVTVHQRFLTLNFTKKQLDQFRETHALEITARLAVPRIEPLKLQAILQFPDGSVAIGKRELLAGAPEGSGPQLTSLLLTNHIEQASGPGDSSDPLRGSNFELFVPDQPRFSPSEKLTIYFGALGVPVNPKTGRPELKITIAVKRGDTAVMTLPPEEAVGSPRQDQLLVLKQFALGKLPPGRYTLVVNGEVPANQETVSRSAEFEIQ
jgi:VWFA-related protein